MTDWPLGISQCSEGSCLLPSPLLSPLVTVITLALPHLAFGFFDEDEPNIVIIMQQSQFVPNTEPRKPAKKGIYVQPQWVDGGYGVQVLWAGHWADPEKEQPLTRRPE